LQTSNKIIQAIGIPFTAILSTIFVLFLISFPLGIYVVFQSEFGDDINYELPITTLELFEGTSVYRTPIDISIGDVFVVLWTFYAIIFVIAFLGPKNGFMKSLLPIISFGKYGNTSNYMFGALQWFSILIFISMLINFIQEGFGIVITPPPVENNLTQFFYVTLAPILEEFGFRLILIGIPLFALYSHRSSVKYFAQCLWNPTNLKIYDSKKAIFLIVFIGILFGFSHIAFGESWSEGKFIQAAISGIILGWVYIRYGFVASLLIHWGTNYFVFSYANFISQLNLISIEEAFSDSLMTSLELLFLLAGILAITLLLVNRFYSKTSTLEI
jgi:hypothetical protein